MESPAFDRFCINLWSGPCCLSTSLMYSFAQRDDTQVLDEPLHAHYLKKTGVERPYRDLVLGSQNNDGQAVINEQILGPRQKKVMFVKHMARHRVGLSGDLLKRARHILMIRNPEILVSLLAGDSSLEETCLSDMCCLFSELRALGGGQPPIIISAETLQADPEGVLRTLCASLDLEFQPGMLSWTPGPRPEDGAWAPWWYHRSVHQSSGFPPNCVPTDPGSTAGFDSEEIEKRRWVVEDCVPLHAQLAAHAIQPGQQDGAEYTDVSLNSGGGGRTEEKKRKRSADDGNAGGSQKQQQKQQKQVGTHSYVHDERNSRILIGIRDGVTGAFNLLQRDQAKVSVFDSGFMLGDGMWEGIRVKEGSLVFKDQHVNRLFENLKAVDINLDISKDQLTELIYRTLDANGMSAASNVHIRLMVTRGLKPTPYQNPNITIGSPLIVIIPEYKEPNPAAATRGLKLMTCHVRRGAPDVQDQNWNSHSKLNCIAACIQANKCGVDESLMLDPNGFVATCNSVNFFCLRGEEVWAPTTKYQMPGITRGAIIDICRQNNIVVRELDFSLTKVYGADEVFVTGTFGGVVPVVEVDGRVINTGTRGPVVERLQKLYVKMVEQDVRSNGRMGTQ